MNLSLFQWRSLKSRITLFTLAIFLISIWALAFYAGRMLREDMQYLLAKQQFATVSFQAAELNRDLGEHLGALGRAATLLGPTMLNHPADLSAFFEERPVLLNQFSGGLIVLALDGAVIAEAPSASERSGVNYMGIDCVASALKDGQSTISHPFLDAHRKVPVFGITAPIRDMHGDVVGALLGLTDVSQANFLDQITESYYGKSGYYLIVDPGVRKIVASTGRLRNLEEVPAAGANPLFDRFVAGDDETGITRDRSGVEILVSAKRIPVANWFIVAALPTDEAFALIDAMKQHMLQGALVLTLLAGGLTWWMIRRELSPMLAAVKTLAALSDTSQPPQALPNASHDEIGELIDGFNHLLETLGHRETALRESDERFRTLHDASFGGIAIHDQGIILDCNQGLANLSGYAAEELIGMNGLDLVTAKWRELVMQNIRSGSDQAYDIEGLRKDGSIYQLSIRGTNIPYKGRVVRVTEFRDITERKEMEEQARQMAFHDTLTQLPNRRLLSDRLRQSMAASKRNGCYGALMFLDLDNFKPLNDTHGHGVGDLLLIEVANRLRAAVREMDTVARFGGDEFVVMLSNLSANRDESAAQAEVIAEKIRLSLSEPYRLLSVPDGKPATMIEHRCTASIGIALYINNQAGEDDILKWADMAMYQAKEAGRNAVRFFAPHL